jgi:hypothetical protein
MGSARNNDTLPHDQNLRGVIENQLDNPRISVMGPSKVPGTFPGGNSRKINILVLGLGDDLLGHAQQVPGTRFVLLRDQPLGDHVA